MTLTPPSSDVAFGPLLRTLRERAGFTQEELAEKAGLSAYAVSALERGRRQRPYPHTVRSLAEALGASAEERAGLLAALPRRTDAAVPSQLAESPDPKPTDDERPTLSVSALAPATRLIGREAEIAEVARLLTDRTTRLVTLTGAGGVGKTRLAAAAADRAAAAFPDGVTLLALAPLSDAADVLPMLARAVQCPVTSGPDLVDRLAEHLAPLRALVVLDNLEHLLDVAEHVGVLVARCAGLSVLVTSRASLRVRGEVELAVHPLPLPDGDDASVVRDAPAVEVFAERARAVSPGFTVTAANASAVAAICRQLAGIPLALELAASRMRFLDAQSLLARLDDAMSRAGGRDLPPRQRTMAATFDWSYDLLAPDEQQLLRVLSVFHGGATLDAIEAVAGGEDVLPLLEALVEHSLVVVTSDEEGTPRFGMLAPIAQSAAARMTADEARAVRDAHAAWCLAFAERAGPEYLAAHQVTWLDRVAREDANLAAAFAWVLETGDGNTAGRIGWALWLDWWMRGRLTEGERYMLAALSLDLDPGVRVHATLTAACMAFAQGNLDAADERWRAGVELANALNDVIARGQTTAGVGLVALARGDIAEAERCFMQSSRDLDRPGVYAEWLHSLVQTWLGTVHMLRGDLAGARQHAELGLASARARGDRLTAYIALFNLSQVALLEGAHDVARQHLYEGIRLTQETRDLANLSYFLDALAVIESESGDPTRVPVLVGAAEAAREAVGSAVYGYYRPDMERHARAVASAREHVGADTFDDALDTGRSLTPEESITYALTD